MTLKPRPVHILLLLVVATLVACNVVPTGTPPPTTDPNSPVPTPGPPPPTTDPSSPIPTPGPEPDVPVHITYLTGTESDRPTIVITLDYNPSAVTIVLEFNPDPHKE